MNLGLLLRARLRQGWSRVRRSAVPVLLASIGAGGAYAVARYGLGHEFPFFAPVSAWIALGFTADRNLRRVAELAIGVAVGVLAGDLLVHWIGTGPVQVAVVLAIAVLVARMLDRGDLLAVQAGVQAVVVVVLPASASVGPVGRWLDAVVGGLVALVVAALSPEDPRRRVRSVAEEAMTEIADLLRTLAEGLRAGDAATTHRALLRGRASQPVLDTWREAAVSARQSARVSPAFRRHRDELAAMVAAATLAELGDRGVVDLPEAVPALLVKTGRAHLFEQLANHRSDSHHLGRLGDRAWRHLFLALPVIEDAFVEDLGIDDLADHPIGVLASLVVLRVLGVHNCSCNCSGENFDVRRWPSVWVRTSPPT